METKYYRTIIFVQDGELLSECDAIMAGGEDKICTPFWEDNGEAVIDLLEQWDMPEYADEDITEEKPGIARYDTRYEKDGYTLLYNTTVGGVYLLYREATEEEIESINR